MGNCTSEKKEEYELAKDYSVGDIVILSDTKEAWRVDKQILIDASPVFKDMLDGITSPANEIHLADIPFHDLNSFIVIIEAQNFDQLEFVNRNLSSSGGLFSLLFRFDCIPLARTVLYSISEYLVADELFDAFVLASRLDDLQCAYRILAQGWKSAKTEDKCTNLRPNEDKRTWGPAQASQIQPSWVWALMAACAKCEKEMGVSD